jgi:hypothetical protein
MMKTPVMEGGRRGEICGGYCGNKRSQVYGQFMFGLLRNGYK